MDIFTRVKALNLPEGQYAVFGSGPLEAYGLRQAKDIDLLVSPRLYEQLKKNGWKEEFMTERKQFKLTGENMEAMKFWDFNAYRPDEAKLIARAELIKGVPFVRLEEVLAWKKAYGRLKDMEDIELIEKHLKFKSPDA